MHMSLSSCPCTTYVSQDSCRSFEKDKSQSFRFAADNQSNKVVFVFESLIMKEWSEADTGITLKKANAILYYSNMTLFQ